MSGENRRKAITELLKNADGPISATKLAEEFLVTRQIIVADIALLRASGITILSDNRGYTYSEPGADNSLLKRVAVKHGSESVKDEFYAVVDNGGRVLDVIVDHSIYGKISAELEIASRYEADKFAEKLVSSGACPLSVLTEGQHVHTLAVRDEESYEQIKKSLENLGILIEAD